MAAGASGRAEKIILAPCTIEQVRIRIYIGPQLDLILRPYLLRYNEMVEDLIRYADGAKQYLDGDDDHIEGFISRPALPGEKVVVWYQNKNLVYPYDFAMDFVIEYAGGVSRFPGGRW